MPQVVRPYRGVSADERRAQRRIRLMEAGLVVIGEQGINGLTMTAVIREAGLTERYFYESFTDRDALLVEMFQEAVQATNLAAGTLRDQAEDDLYARCRATVAGALSVMTDDPRVGRAFLEAVGNATLRPYLRDALQGFSAFMLSELSQGQKRNAEDRARLEIAATALIGGITDAATAWLAGSLKVSRDELIDECAHLCVAAVASVDARSAGRSKR
ncbi:MAG: TetR/AcrR family transcriptional regulator [Solirubrobacteraceae bacterium]|nr:TetR/AcrR family transcriptional regulator [Solirubrobacteraceae bacterium]